MSSIVGSLLVNLQANTAQFSDGLKRASNSIKSWSSSVKSSVASARSFINSSTFKWGALGAGGTVVAGLAASVKAARTQIAEERKLESVLKATGNAAGFTSEQLKSMAGDLQKVTNFGDETTISAMAVLATFKEIKGDQFKEAVAAAQDMSSVLGSDLQSSIMQIGKALNDPAKGITALSKAGVSFTESQKEMIRSLQESGDMMGAQKIILSELQNEFGGAAKAMADPWTQLNNQIGDLGESIGIELLPFLKVAADEAKKFFDSFGAGTSGSSDKVSGLGKTFGVVADVIEVVVLAVESLWAVLQKAMAGILKFMIDLPGIQRILGEEGTAGVKQTIDSYDSAADNLMSSIRERTLGPSASERAANERERQRRLKKEGEDAESERIAEAEGRDVGAMEIQFERFKRQLPSNLALSKQDMLSGTFGLGKWLGGALGGQGLGGASRFVTGAGLSGMFMGEADRAKLKDEGTKLAESVMTPMEQFKAEMARNQYLLTKGYINQQTFDRAAEAGVRDIVSRVPTHATTALAGSQEAYRAITSAKFSVQERMAADIKKQAADAAKTATNTQKMADKLDDLETIT